ncbi:hypothetical protein E6P09_07495 [Haloferax mediterranei ATCC 33500]|uniref:Uncharacterized protein n=1 Tax=Haloferax mediterranei (strain ATCC 33500 / DSM 1411 / JCM 8866 / NBRC 14739 / NCIMB 2177 / R-4) TaxID=523841 RepID=M0IZH4_HALMT|nr:hypothetical protein [Haloferax mediterranei]AHZ22016.1 hypothetical protein BM92_04765 [Haloferax mediterranei ATCC 33500]EMA02111.1 hypothetical protein C439_06010 [Haloferax mediterranei ATCC 33500]MDX5988703.1 hypothetical protein [Haloferax mediterranei ATCC 33500]QCQ75111.1 hypothetical protein E6P09_07495 [Haloferax mediterranei ATCC 33500]
MRGESIEEFSYGGRLVFNGVYSTNVLDADLDFDHVVDEQLQDFTSGSIDVPGRGYQTIPFQEYIEQEREIGGPLTELLGQVHGFRHQKERWDRLDVDLSGNGASGKRPTLTGVSTFDAYWAKPDYLFVMGDKTKAEAAGSLLKDTFRDLISIEELFFDPDFLLWLFSKKKNDEKLPGELSISMLTDAEITGEERDFFGKHSKVGDSTDVTKSAPVLMGVLQQKGLVSIEGVFGLSDKFVRARISDEGRVHIKADHAIAGSSDFERIAISIAFLRLFTSLHDEWKQMDPKDRYPPLEFFMDIYNECKRQGVNITFSIDDIVEEYRKKGSQEEYDERQSGLGEFEAP